MLTALDPGTKPLLDLSVDASQVVDMTQLFRCFTAAVFLLAIGSAPVQAGVFNYPHFVTPGEFAIGVEPELTLTNGAGAAINARYTHGLNDLLNLTGIVGTGGGPRQFRLGAAATFDFFPDIQGQPGIGITLQTLWIKVPTAGRPDGSDDTSGQFELTGIPYIHKSIVTKDNGEIEPYVGVPIGMAFQNGQYKALATVAVGSMIKHSDHFRSTIEFGIAVNHTDTYLSGGITYYY
jgi:hypothetical protein